MHNPNGEEKDHNKPQASRVNDHHEPRVRTVDTLHGTVHSTRRGSHEGRTSIISATLVSHALREVVSDHIMAGPHGALQPTSSMASLITHGGLTSISGHQILTLSFPDGVEFPVFFEDAITETGHGWFQHKLMALCGFIYSCCSLSTTTLSFVVPAAKWDFHLSSADMGVLNTAPLCGMVVGAYIWGNFADSKGRKFVLLYSLLIDAFASFISSLCQNFTLFFICRIFNGFAIIGATSIVFAYLGEFLDSRVRDRYLSRLELFWTFGIISLPVIGFLILPRHWELHLGNLFVYNSWRIFVFTCGIPSLIAALLISRMPESPRFLYLQGEYEKTKDVLVSMFVTNYRVPPEEFPVKVLHIEGSMDYHFAKLHGASKLAKIKIMMRGIYKQHLGLLRGRSLFNIFLCCFIDFGLMSVYFTFMLWIPEILHRHQQYLEHHPEAKANLCTVVGFKPESDDKKIDYETFIHTFIVCLACLPSNIMLLCFIQFVSKKALLVTLLVCAAGPTLAVYFMETEFQLTTMLCLFEAIATLVEAVLFCAIVEIFPLGTRGSALSLTVTVGRLGAIIGNIVFGANLETNCRELFYGMSATLFLSGLSALLLPRMAGGEEFI